LPAENQTEPIPTVTKFFGLIAQKQLDMAITPSEEKSKEDSYNFFIKSIPSSLYDKDKKYLLHRKNIEFL
jgi:hypothetical protein